MNLRHEFQWRERDEPVRSGVKAVIMRVCENERLACNTPAATSNVFGGCIELPNAPTAVCVKNYDSARSGSATEHPRADNRLRFRLWRRAPAGHARQHEAECKK